MLDLCSCAGVGADGYVRAGFRVTCLDEDAKALRWCPWETVQRDALDALRDRVVMAQFDFVHASFPCQLFSATRQLAIAQGKGQGKAIDLLTPGLELLRELDIPWVVENVPRSPVKDMAGAVQMCGSAFGLKVQRHRWFAASDEVKLTGTECCHAEAFDVDEVSGKPRPWGVYYAKGDEIPSGGRTCKTLEHGMECMGVGRRMPWEYLREGLPPVYTEMIGRQVKESMGW